MNKPEPIPKEALPPLEPSELVWLLERGLKQIADPRIKSMSVDGDRGDSELMVDTIDGRTLIVHSSKIVEEDTEEEPA